MDPDPTMGLPVVGRVTDETVALALEARDIESARDKLLNFVQSTRYGTAIYYDGWDGLGTSAVLRSIVQVLQSKEDLPPELRFGRIICIDCSIWKNKRVMQKTIAEELKLDHKTMSIFDKQDEDDDFNGVDLASRDVIRDVAVVINRILVDSSYMMIFIDGGEQEVALSRLGVSESHDSILISTIKRRFPSKGLVYQYRHSSKANMVLSKLRNTKFALGNWLYPLKSSEVHALVREEAGSILIRYPCMREDDQETIIDCYLYVLFLHHSFHEGAIQLCVWAAHGANYWLCDGIIQGARTREIIHALYQEVSFDYDDASFVNSVIINKRELILHPYSPYLAVDGDDLSWINANMHPHWISITLKNKIVSENMMKGLLSRASSIILSFESNDSTYGLPNDLLEPCNNLRVLILSYCSFNFSSPLFRHCYTLKFLGLDHCRNNNTRQLLKREDYNTKWAFLHSLWVLDLRYTDWDEILCQANMDVIINMIELNIEGFMCWQYTSQLEGRLPHLQRLRIVKPQRQADTSIETDNSFMGRTNLEVLDLSGNKDMKKLPTSLSKARNLQVLILDGCVGLEKVVLSCSFLRSFSFDGYGPASNWTSTNELPPKGSRPKCPSDDSNNKDVKTSLINLEGCTQLKDLFLRGLPNLVELDLSGCQIKILDFETMVMDVPRLQKLFLVGCQHLRAITWVVPEVTKNLELLSIDTRSGDRVVDPGHTRLSIAHPLDGRFRSQVCAITADARLARSFISVIEARDTYFSFRIHFTSANIVCDENTIEEHNVVVASLYNDVSTKVCDSSSTTLQVFPQPPTAQSHHHIEIGDGSCNVENELRRVRSGGHNLQELILCCARSLHVHDTWTDIAIPYPRAYDRTCRIKWCRVERCPKLDHVFPPQYSPSRLKTIWASDLLMARCICSKGRSPWHSNVFLSLKHLHLRSCPNLRFALPIWAIFFPMLETLHIIHCGSLTHVFALDEEYNINTRIWFPDLTTIHLHDLPALQQICEVNMMITPKLETIRTRGCWSLRRLPAFTVPEAGRKKKKPVVEMEKDVWDALEWDGVDAGHHPSLYEVARQSRYYKGRRLIRGTVLR